MIFLDAFANAPPVPFPVTDTNPFRVGTFTFDYGGLGLQLGDSVTLDIFGRDDGSATRTTALAVRPPGSAMTIQINPDFATPPGSARSVFTITVIPERGSPIVLAMICVLVGTRRRTRRCGSSRFLWR